MSLELELELAVSNSKAWVLATELNSCVEAVPAANWSFVSSCKFHLFMIVLVVSIVY